MVSCIPFISCINIFTLQRPNNFNLRHAGLPEVNLDLTSRSVAVMLIFQYYSQPACATCCFFGCACDGFGPSNAVGCANNDCFCRPDIVSTSVASYMTYCITNCCKQDTLGPDLQTAMATINAFCSQWTDPNYVLAGTALPTTAMITGSPATPTEVVVVSTVLINSGPGGQSISTVATHTRESVLIWISLALLSALALFARFH
jgi:hypothetical protein